MVKSFICLSILLAGLTTGYSQAKSSSSQSKPNTIFPAIDDLSDWINSLELGGLPGLKTPNFDSLRKMSMSFTNAHIPSLACAHSHVAIMTGVSSRQYPA